MKNKFYVLISIVTFMLLVIEYFLSDQNTYFTRFIVMIGTLVLALISILSYYISMRSIGSTNPYAFVRGVMGGTFIKFFLCIVAVGLLLYLTHKKLHKPDLFLLMFVYVIYTVIETAILSKLGKQEK
jgi:hypothetical protein